MKKTSVPSDKNVILTIDTFQKRGHYSRGTLFKEGHYLSKYGIFCRFLQQTGSSLNAQSEIQILNGL